MSGDRHGSSWRDDRHSSGLPGQDGFASPGGAPESGPVGSEPFAAPAAFGMTPEAAHGMAPEGAHGMAPGAAFGMAPETAENPEDDVRVAGSAARPGGAGDTGRLPPVESSFAGAAFPGATEVISSDEPAPQGARRPRQGRRAAGRRPASMSGSSRSSSSRSGSSGRTGLKVAIAAAGAVVVLGGGAAAFALGGSDSGSSKSKGASSDNPSVASGGTNAAMPAADPAKVEAQRKKLAVDRASRAARDDGDPAKLMPKGKPVPTPTKTADPSGNDKGGSGGGGGPSGDPVPAGAAQQIAKGMMGGYGFSGSGQFGCLVKLWNRESGWNTHAANPSGAYGIPQALPGSKMASAGPDWQNNAGTQIKWGLGYIKNRYGTPCGAWAHSQSTGWY
ncbi:aggregation-promoting factor C-terminal-like domain-containing protein [Actinomadura harenae]|uniref:aggregation-promoting factor C-terminal-like domain-containing protein n=1 Tax=Actinomadura harenae TaxID=2483351 RepID=UPI001F1D91A4|nr:hypothetical protein [Actinomadura harenae]